MTDCKAGVGGGRCMVCELWDALAAQKRLVASLTAENDRLTLAHKRAESAVQYWMNFGDNDDGGGGD